MSTLNKILLALSKYDEVIQEKKDATPDIEEKCELEIKRQQLYGFIAGYTAGACK